MTYIERSSVDLEAPPFAVGQVIEHRETGARYRVTRDYVPPVPGSVDVYCFELVAIEPGPFIQAASCARRYQAVASAPTSPLPVTTLDQSAHKAS